MSQVRTELGSSGAISLGSTAVRNLAGVSSGAIAMSQLRGKSALTFSPPPEDFYVTGPFNGVGSYGINASQSVVWTYSKAAGITASRASGTAGSSISFTTTSSKSGGFLNIQATLNGVQVGSWNGELWGGSAIQA